MIFLQGRVKTSSLLEAPGWGFPEEMVHEFFHEFCYGFSMVFVGFEMGFYGFSTVQVCLKLFSVVFLCFFVTSGDVLLTYGTVSGPTARLCFFWKSSEGHVTSCKGGC